ncbi:MAG: 4-hydroxy-3-methylbut-2-enyl diphosphate reductase [Deltaproteobacteria bacterium]|jgi:4-hydroxy-3-methylbut-2-enyl diphosphate reductase|nr:MAG: 4-hydroxy-3-methylbut-2-enyl diphosphate reductase [Deltaproteobacteria bacterium]
MVKKIILAETAGVCFGVERALRKSFEVIESKADKKVHSLGPIIHNPQVIKRLEEKGIKVVEKLEDAPSEGTVIIRAHGVPVGTVDTAKKRGLNVVDLTCPIVKKLQYAVRKLAEEGYFTVIVGDKNHPEIIGARSYADPERVIVVSNKSEIPPEVFAKRKVGVVAQTTIAFDKFREVVDEFLARSTEEIKVFNTICDDIFNKQREAVELAKSVDVMIVIGGKNSSNTTKIAKLCHEVNPNTYQVETPDEINSLGLNLDGKTIGITAGASTPSWIIEDILEGLQKI